MRIAWFSRHAPHPDQIAALKNIFGAEASVVVDTRPYGSDDELVRRCLECDADEIVLVANIKIMGEVCRAGYKPLIANMRNAGRNRHGERQYEFVGFHRIVSMDLVIEELGAC